MNPGLFANVFGGVPQRLVVGVEIVFGFFTRAPKKSLVLQTESKGTPASSVQTEQTFFF